MAFDLHLEVLAISSECEREIKKAINSIKRWYILVNATFKGSATGLAHERVYSRIYLICGAGGIE